MAHRHSVRLSVSSGILQGRLFLLMLQSKCSVPPALTFRACLKGGFLLLRLTKLSVHPFLQQAFPRAGKVRLLCAELLVLPGISDTWLSLTW